MRVCIDREAIVRRVRDEAEQGMERLAQQVLADCGEFVPVDTGALRRSGAVRGNPDGSAEIVWDRPYARTLYRGARADGGEINYSTGRNPMAQGEWFEAARRKHGGWQAAARELLRGGG